MGWAFIQHITDYLRRPRFGDPKAPTLWPSEASALITNKWGEQEVVGKCKRALFFRYLVDTHKYFGAGDSPYKTLVDHIVAEKLPTDPYMIWIWRQGELYEDYCVGMAKESGVYIASQIPIYIKELNVSGKIDLVVLDPDTCKVSKTEIKSVYGHNANFVLGTPGGRGRGELGTPKDSNLMQIALYDYRTLGSEYDWGASRLVYGARDTGRFAEYEVKTELDPETGVTHIKYRGIAPNNTAEVTSPITINSILSQYRYIQDCIDDGVIPERDYEIQYSDEKIQQLYDRKELSKADTERVEKRNKQVEESKAKLNKQIEKGDWQCNWCDARRICYDENNQPRDI